MSMSILVDKYIAKVKNKCFQPIRIGLQTVGCGKCMACRQKLCNDWVFRCQQEFKHKKFSGFVSLTYKDEYLDFNYFDDINNQWFASLNPSDFNKFINSLTHYIKKRYNESISYLMCAEYGEKEGATHRPHFHFMYFCDSPDVHNDMMKNCKRLWIEKIGHDAKGRLITDLRGRIDIVKSNGDHINSDTKVAYKEQQPYFGLMPYLVEDMMKDTNPDNSKGKNWIEGEFVGDWCKRLEMIPPYHRASRGFGMCYLTSQVKRFHLSSPENNQFVMIDTPSGPFKHRLPECYKTKLYGRSSKVNFWRKARFEEANRNQRERTFAAQEEELRQIETYLIEREGIQGFADYLEFNAAVLRFYNQRHNRQRLTDVALSTSKARH